MKSRKFNKKKTYEEPFYRKFRRKTFKKKDKASKLDQTSITKKIDLTDVICYKCGKKGHISKYCKVSKKIQELDLGNETLGKLSALLLETSESETTSSEKYYPQIDEIVTTSSSEHESESSSEDKHLNMLTKEQTLILDAIQHINDPDVQKRYLEQLRQSLEKEPEPQQSEIPIINTDRYDLTTILNRKKNGKKPLGDIQILQSEIKTIKSEIKELKDKQQKDSDLIQFLVSKLTSEPSDSDETKGLEP